MIDACITRRSLEKVEKKVIHPMFSNLKCYLTG